MRRLILALPLTLALAGAARAQDPGLAYPDTPWDQSGNMQRAKANLQACLTKFKAMNTAGMPGRQRLALFDGCLYGPLLEPATPAPSPE